MSLKLVNNDGGKDDEATDNKGTSAIVDLLPSAEIKALPPTGASSTSEPRKREIPPLPTSSGKAIPISLAQLLRSQEPVVWWSSKQDIEWQAAIVSSVGGLLLLTFASLFAPEIWALPLLDLVGVITVTQAVTLVLIVREWTSRRHVVVTDTAVADIDWRGGGDRISFRNVRKVKRDWWTGGVRLVGEAHEVRIPPSLMDDARAAIANQMAYTLDFGSVSIEDRLSWFPKAGR